MKQTYIESYGSAIFTIRHGAIAAGCYAGRYDDKSGAWPIDIIAKCHRAWKVCLEQAGQRRDAV